MSAAPYAFSYGLMFGAGIGAFAMIVCLLTVGAVKLY